MSLLRVDLPGFLILVTLFFNCRAYAFIADARPLFYVTRIATQTPSAFQRRGESLLIKLCFVLLTPFLQFQIALCSFVGPRLRRKVGSKFCG